MSITQSVRDLLAIIHRDGGHHTEEVGIAQSAVDAGSLYYHMAQQNERMRSALLMIDKDDLDRDYLSEEQLAIIDAALDRK